MYMFHSPSCPTCGGTLIESVPTWWRRYNDISSHLRLNKMGGMVKVKVRDEGLWQDDKSSGEIVLNVVSRG